MGKIDVPRGKSGRRSGPGVATLEVPASNDALAARASFGRERQPAALISAGQSTGPHNWNRSAVLRGTAFDAVFVVIGVVAVILAGVIFFFELLP